jgi:hypothetical protein
VSQKSPRVKLAFADSGYAGDETQRPAYEASRIRPKRRFPSRCAITPDPLPIKKVASPAPPLPRERSTNPLEFHPCHAEWSAGYVLRGGAEGEFTGIDLAEKHRSRSLAGGDTAAPSDGADPDLGDAQQ